MKLRVILLFVALVGAAAVSAWLRLAGPDAPAPALSKPLEYAVDTSAPQAQRSASTSQLIHPPRAAEPPTNTPTEADDAPPDLLLDASGRLIENVRLRDAIERLLSNDPRDLERSKHDLVASLPPVAAQQMLEMVERFVNYRAALRQVLPESPQAMSEQDARTMLQTVHALRVTYFGPELTEVFFGAEESPVSSNTADGAAP